MSKKGNDEKSRQLGMNHGTATSRLRKHILFGLAKRCGLDGCYRCGKKIQSVDDFTIDHKIPWMYSENPLDLFFDFDNIAFSHASCNCGAARQMKPSPRKHPSHAAYKKGCRCEGCRTLRSESRKRYKRNTEEREKNT